MQSDFTAGNCDMWFETQGKKNSKSSQTLLLLHGFTGAHSTWKTLCEKLSKMGYFLILPDLPGHGRSATIGPPLCKDMTLDEISGHLQKLLDILGVGKTALLGYSMGGRMALHFAIKFQDRLTCLILESGSPGIQDPKEREMRKIEDDSLAMDIEKHGLDWFVDKWENVQLFQSRKTLNPQIIELARKERFSQTVNGLANSLRFAGTGIMEPLWSQLEELKVPVLLIVGEKDRKFRSIAEEMKKHMSSNCSIGLVKSVGHAPHIESPEVFEDIVKQFLSDMYRSGER
jgi:2-succinyl-6-hydroxy-2,4-cyclohexadiene-1-carboxylate synthase